METIIVNDQEMALGCRERTAEVGSVRPCLEESINVIPQDKWEPCDFSALVPSVGLQAAHGACVAFQSLGALAGQRQISGLGNTALSPWWLYAQICGGRDAGASIHEALQVLHDIGCCRLETCPEFTLDPSVGGVAAKTEGARYQIKESFDCANRAAIATAIQLRMPTPLGVQVYSNFTALQQIGGYLCVPKPAGRLRGGHCVCGVGLAYIGGQWRVKLDTRSWGDDFGDKGCAWYELDWISDSYADAWAVRSVTFTEN
jgi:hypothetical protein